MTKKTMSDLETALVNDAKRRDIVVVKQQQIFYVKLPWPPSVNSLYRRKKTGGMFIPKKGKQWFDEAEAVIRTSSVYRAGMFPEGVRVRVDFALVPPTARAYDIDNRDKAVFDVLEKSGVLHNDNQIYLSTREKYDKQPGGAASGVYIRISAIEENTGQLFNG